MQAFFPVLETFLISTFWYTLELFQRCSPCLINRCKSLYFHRSLQFWGTGKSCRVPNPVNMVTETWLSFCFWSKNLLQATMNEQVHYQILFFKYRMFFKLPFFLVLAELLNLPKRLTHHGGFKLFKRPTWFLCLFADSLNVPSDETALALRNTACFL